MAQATEANVANVLLGILQKHQGQWVSDAALSKELASTTLNSLQIMALEHLARNGRIYMRPVRRDGTPGHGYEYKARWG